MRLDRNAALVVIDVQKGFDTPGIWGKRNNPEAERNIVALCELWQATERPMVCVRHTADRIVSPFASWSPGRQLKKQLADVRFDVTIEKSVRSAFIGQPDLKEWLMTAGIRQLVVTGIQTNMCVESTVRMGSDLGFKMVLPIDATHTFDARRGDTTVSADELRDMTAA
ncbi:MAG: isochorismatase family protein, partial [Bifidobacteriaceae bacterium]|nr:isochorismatase family protein [Bifidobacteriaceae bacterium]